MSDLFDFLGLSKRSVFVSYHHKGDQAYYNEFSRIFSSYYGVVRDNSIGRIMDSDDADYMMRCIRENHLTGTSCTIVLCGAETPWRKFVDWEIKATLDKEHGLIAVNLPTNPRNPEGRFTVPDRLQDNIVSGYAVWTYWEVLTYSTTSLRGFIEQAIARPKLQINNRRDLRTRNG